MIYLPNNFFLNSGHYTQYCNKTFNYLFIYIFINYYSLIFIICAKYSHSINSFLVLIGFIIFCYSTQIGVPGGKTGNMFINVPIEVTCYQPETVGCMLHLFKYLIMIIMLFNASC